MCMRLWAIPVASCFLALATPTYAQDWTMYLGDLSHTSFRPGETRIYPGNAGQLRQLWKTSLGSVVSSGVTVAGGSLYFGDWSGNFHSMNAITGAANWSQYLGKAADPVLPECEPRGIGVSSQPAVAGNTVYVGGGDSAVYAMDSGTGRILWRSPLADPAVGTYLWSSPMLSRNALYIGIASLTDCPVVRGGLARIPLDDPANPQIVYFTPAGTQGAGAWATPAIDEPNNLVYVTTGNAEVQDPQQGVWGSALLALDATTLQIQSYFFLPIPPVDNDADWGSSPLLFESGGQPMVAANGKTGVMYVLHRPDLAPLWSYRLAQDCDSPVLGCGSISTPAFDGSVLVTGAGQPVGGPAGMVYAFDPAARQLLWQSPAAAAVLGPVTLTPGLVFASNTSGLTALNAATGAVLWTDGGASGGLYSQPVVSGGILYATYVNGDVVAWGVPPTGGGSPVLAVSQSALHFLYTHGGPVPSAQSVAVSSTAPSVSFAVASDSPWLTTDVQSAATPALIAVRANPSAMSPGVYSGSLNVFVPGNGPIAVQASMVVNPALPSLNPAGIVNAASFRNGLAPGSLFTIFAANLSAGSLISAGAPWATSWNGIAVKINGIAAPLDYVSPTQINAQVPYEIAPGTAQLTIESNGTTAGPAGLTIQSATPGIFGDAGGRAAAINQDGTVNLPGNPAPAGSFISVYLTGQGQVDRLVASGAAAPIGPISNTLAQTTATIGGVPAPVSFSGLAPGWVGLGQVNLQVPNLPAGDQPVIVTIGGVASNSAVVTVTR
jgi:uncharacterized protein (TIGR03437 family)